MAKPLLITVLLLIAAFAPLPRGDDAAVRVASKKFTESVILGEMLRGLSASTGLSTEHLRELGGTRLVFEALVNGEVDAYVEYTGTLANELFSDRNITSLEDLRAALAESGISLSEPLGFNNTYALGMNRETAARHDVTRISDLSRVSGLNYGLSGEFFERADGWPGLQQAYGLAPLQARGLDHDIAWQQLELGQVDVIDIYTTEARIDALDVRVLEDDRTYFPRYDAVILYRTDLAERFAEGVDALLQLAGQIDERQMTTLNRRVEIDGQTDAAVAADFLQQQFSVESGVRRSTRTGRLVQSTIEHLELVRRSLLPAILFAVPLGIAAAWRPRFGQICLAIVGIFQTIPSFALLVLLLPLASWLSLKSVGAGSVTAVFALFLYSLLPIVRSTHSGIKNIDPALREAAAVLNLPWRYRLLHVELPLAAPAIFSGIKTAAVMNIGFATLGALVGAGGYGQPILSGIRLADTRLILEGAIPAAVLAVIVQLTFDFFERRPRAGR
ncbi:MAG: ABC transporter permease subunit [Planctomycetaceae bacterium]|nr:ABC transporter permease subunit [Planctomycetaceae bacterium]